jgi:hypothetical protein
MNGTTFYLAIFLIRLSFDAFDLQNYNKKDNFIS